MKIVVLAKKNPEIKPLPKIPDHPTKTPEITPEKEKSNPLQPAPEIHPHPHPHPDPQTDPNPHPNPEIRPPVKSFGIPSR